MARLAAHARHLQKLQQSFEKTVPAMLARSCRVANFKLGVVIIHAENGAAAAKLRQIAPRLSEDFRSRGEQVTEIRIKVQPLDIAAQHQPAPRAATLGEGGRASIGRLTETLPEGPLKTALDSLIARSSSRKQ
jgi:hypothetical protein